MKWLVLGDIHAEFGELAWRLDEINIEYDAILQLGDFGIWKRSLNKKRKALKRICEKPVYFVRGNHEEYSQLRYNYKTNKAVEIPFLNSYEDQVLLMLSACEHKPVFINDEMITIGDLNILGMGGAYSIDREYRIFGKSWWKEEVVSKEKVEAAKDLKPDIIISHAAPPIVFKKLGKNIRGDSELGHLYHNVQPRFWWFGHYHDFMTWFDEETGTTFVGFPPWNQNYGIFDTEFMELNIKHWR